LEFGMMFLFGFVVWVHGEKERGKKLD